MKLHVNVYEIEMTQRFDCFFQRTQRFQKTLKRIKTFVFLLTSSDP